MVVLVVQLAQVLIRKKPPSKRLLRTGDVLVLVGVRMARLSGDVPADATSKVFIKDDLTTFSES